VPAVGISAASCISTGLRHIPWQLKNSAYTDFRSLWRAPRLRQLAINLPRQRPYRRAAVTYVGRPRTSAKDRRVAEIALPLLRLAAVLPGLAALPFDDLKNSLRQCGLNRGAECTINSPSLVGVLMKYEAAILQLCADAPLAFQSRC
jgi:hypothetical protein